MNHDKLKNAEWVFCPKCDVAQTVQRVFIDCGGYRVTTCFQCSDSESCEPYQFDPDCWKLDDATPEEIEAELIRLGGNNE